MAIDRFPGIIPVGIVSAANQKMARVVKIVGVGAEKLAHARHGGVRLRGVRIILFRIGTPVGLSRCAHIIGIEK